jgi:hypothetical protein
MEISRFKIIEKHRETEASMNVTEKMHRIQLAANAWYAAMRHQFDEAFHRLWERVRRG